MDHIELFYICPFNAFVLHSNLFFCFSVCLKHGKGAVGAILLGMDCHALPVGLLA
jgi:hypothetical protein